MARKQPLRFAFIAVPGEVAERRDLGWVAKGLLSLLRFKQGADPCVRIGLRALAIGLGVSVNAVARTLAQAEAASLLVRIGQGCRGCRGTYDVRAVPSVAHSNTLSQVSPERRQSSVANSDSGKYPVENAKETETLLSLCFVNPSVKQQRAFLNSLHAARQEGVPIRFVARGLLSKRIDGPPWKRIDDAIARARAIGESLNSACGKHFEDLQHVVDYAGGGANGLPRRIGTTAGVFSVAAILQQVTTWPTAKDTAGAESRA